MTILEKAIKELTKKELISIESNKLYKLVTLADAILAMESLHKMLTKEKKKEEY